MIKSKIDASGPTFAQDFLHKTYYINDFKNMTDIIEDNIDYHNTIRLISNSFGGIDIPMDDVLKNGFCLRNSNVSSRTFNTVIDNDIHDSLLATPEGGTLASSGILAANNVFKQENNNNNKLMIIISDGDETSLSAKDGNTHSKRKSFYITQNLINMGMCQSIADNKITMVFIAIGYYPEKNLNTHNYIDWKKCVGEKIITWHIMPMN